MKKFLQKIKLNKGATGADIVVSLSVLTIGIAVVSIIFVNMTLMNKRTNRTAAATRVLTNVMESLRSYAGTATFSGSGSDGGYDRLEKLVAESSENFRDLYTKENSYEKTMTVTGPYTLSIGEGTSQINTTIPANYVVTISFKSFPFTYSDDPESPLTDEEGKRFDCTARLTVDVKYNDGNNDKHISINTGLCRRNRTVFQN